MLLLLLPLPPRLGAVGRLGCGRAASGANLSATTVSTSIFWLPHAAAAAASTAADEQVSLNTKANENALVFEAAWVFVSSLHSAKYPMGVVLDTQLHSAAPGLRASIDRRPAARGSVRAGVDPGSVTASACPTNTFHAAQAMTMLSADDLPTWSLLGLPFLAAIKTSDVAASTSGVVVLFFEQWRNDTVSVEFAAGVAMLHQRRDQLPQSEVSFEAKKATKLDSSLVGPSDPEKANIAPVQSW